MAFKKGDIPWNTGLKYKRGGGMFGVTNPNYKDGYSITYEGYVCLHLRGKRVLEHRLVAELALGRKLRRTEVVHHINGDKTDNRNCNLLICTMAYHRWLENKMANLYKKEHFEPAPVSGESRSEYVKMYANLGTDCRNAHGKYTDLHTA